MIVWTIQSLCVWEILQRDGILYGPDTRTLEFDDPIMQQEKAAYDWLVQQMEKRIGPRPQPERYPLWAWYQWYGPKQRRPDLRSRHLDAGKKGVRIEFTIADDQILLSDFSLWHAPLNAGYLGLSEEEDEAFYHGAEQQGLKYGDLMAHPLYRAKILESWERIFDFHKVHENDYWGNLQTQRIQGTFWQLSLDQVHQATFFTSRNV